MREMQAPGPYLVVFPNRSFFLLVVAYAINTFGNWLTVVAAVAMATFEWHASALEVGGLIALFLLPPVIVCPLAGRLGDRLDKRQLLIAANSAAAVMVVLMPFAGNV